MGVIRWVEVSSDRHCGDGVMALGYLGNEQICYVADYGSDPNADGTFHLFTFSDFPGRRFSERWIPCDDLQHGKTLAEDILYDWMEGAGLAPQEDLDAARDSLAEYGEATLVRCSLERDVARLEAENERLREDIALMRKYPAGGTFVAYNPLARYPAEDRNRIRDLLLRGNAVGVAMEDHDIDVGVLSKKAGVASELVEAFVDGHVREIGEETAAAIEAAVAEIVGGGA